MVKILPVRVQLLYEIRRIRIWADLLQLALENKQQPFGLILGKAKFPFI